MRFFYLRLSQSGSELWTLKDKPNFEKKIPLIILFLNSVSQYKISKVELFSKLSPR